MQFLGGNAYFSAQPEFKAVCKTGACIYVNSRRVNALLEDLRAAKALSYDALAVLGAESVDVLYRFIEALDDF